jgi:hypothetical protein
MELKLKENSSTVLFKVHTNDSDFTRCNYAFVKFTKSLIDRINELREAREKLGCYEVTDFYGFVKFLNEDEFAYESGEKNISEELSDSLWEFTKGNKGSWCVESVDLEDVPTIRTEADTVHVNDYGVRFISCMKYAGVELCTEKISWEEIDKMVVGD